MKKELFYFPNSIMNIPHTTALLQSIAYEIKMHLTIDFEKLASCQL